MSENNPMFTKSIKKMKLMEYEGKTLFYKPSWHLFSERRDNTARVSLVPEEMRSVLRYAALNTGMMSRNGEKVAITVPSKDYSYNMGILVSIESECIVIITMCDIPENGFSETFFKDIESFVIDEYVWENNIKILSPLSFGQAMEMYCETIIHEVDKSYRPNVLKEWDHRLYGDNLFSLINDNKLYIPLSNISKIKMTLTLDEVIHALNYGILYSNLTHDGKGKRVVVFPNSDNVYFSGVLVEVKDDFIEFVEICDRGHTSETKHCIYRTEKQMFLDDQFYKKATDELFKPEGSEEEIFKKISNLLEENPKHRFTIVATRSVTRISRGGDTFLLLKNIYVNSHYLCGTMWIPMKERLKSLSRGDVFSATATPYIYKNATVNNLSSITLSCVRDINIHSKTI